MRFAVDAHAIGQCLTGNEVYIRNLIREFAELDRTAQFIAYVNKNSPAELVPLCVRRREVSGNPFVRLGWQLASHVRTDAPDLLHVQYTAPLFCGVPVVASVHDVSFLEHPEFFSAARAAQLKWTVGRTVRSAARVITPSEFSQKAVARWYGLDPEEVAVVPIAVSKAFRASNRVQAWERISRKHALGGPFVVHVGDLQPRKNQIGLIRAFEEVVVNNPQLPHWLVLVGKGKFHAAEVHEAARRSRVAERIRFTGYVDDEELRQIYSAADLFVFPSLYEGFGLPILEAMACGCPVACSKATAMPEVADSAAILFDPRSVSEMARAMQDLLLDRELRSRMSRLGLQRSTQFSWEATARKTLDVYYEVAGRRGGSTVEKVKSVSAAGS